MEIVIALCWITSESDWRRYRRCDVSLAKPLLQKQSHFYPVGYGLRSLLTINRKDYFYGIWWDDRVRARTERRNWTELILERWARVYFSSVTSLCTCFKRSFKVILVDARKCSVSRKVRVVASRVIRFYNCFNENNKKVFYIYIKGYKSISKRLLPHWTGAGVHGLWMWAWL